MYEGLAAAAARSGHAELADTLLQYSRELAWNDPTKKQAHIDRAVADTMQTFQALMHWGDEQAAQRSSHLHHTREGFGALLFIHVRKDVALPVLSEVYARLGVTQEREQAVATKIPGNPETPGWEDKAFSIVVPGGVTLMETRETDTHDGGAIYKLWGRKSQ